MRCGEREFRDSFLKRSGFFYVILLGSYSICELIGETIKRPLHLYDT